MINLIIGFILGFYVATMGVTGIATMIDNGVKFVQNTKVNIETK